MDVCYIYYKMPFTFSHPAAILPLRNLPPKYYSMTGLVIGSMTPDFEYFLRMNVGSIYSHSFWGLFYFDLPVGIGICFVFHNIVRNTFVDHLPKMIKERFWDLKAFDWNSAFKQNWPVIIISIWIGAASHIIWDDFTHPLGYFVTKSSLLKHKIQLTRHGIPVYNILQILSSLIGGLIVLNFIWRMPKTKIQTVNNKDLYWVFVSIIVVTIMLVRFFDGLTIEKYSNVIVSIISSFFIALILTPFLRYSNSSKRI